MVHFKTVQSNALKTLFEVLKDILHDIVIQFDSHGIRVMTVDGSHVSIIHLRLDSGKFEEYECDAPCHIGVNAGQVFKLLKMAGNQDTIAFEFDPSSVESELVIRIENEEKKAATTFRLKLLDVDLEELSMPDIEFDSVVTMPAPYFQRLCKDMSNISDVISICNTQESLKLSCKGDFASQETIIGSSSTDATVQRRSNLGQNEAFEASYLLKYLNLFNKATNLSNTMEMYMRKDYPLILKYGVANLGELRFCLAPKIEDSAGA